MDPCASVSELGAASLLPPRVEVGIGIEIKDETGVVIGSEGSTRLLLGTTLGTLVLGCEPLPLALAVGTLVLVASVVLAESVLKLGP